MSGRRPIEDRDLTKLAPKFHLAVAQCLEQCRAAGIDAFVWEAYRSNALQMLYYERGRPPTAEWPHPVTGAATNDYSWHGYGLAVDVVSEKNGWFNPEPAMIRTMHGDALRAYLDTRKRDGIRWFWQMAQICKRCGCDWGGDWSDPHKDPPHLQFGGLRASPSDRAREILHAGGMQAVWRVVGAA